jgi:hypothetical protein
MVEIILVIICSFLSIFGCSFTFLSFYLFEDLREQPGLVIALWLSLAAFGYSITSFLWFFYDYKPTCIISATLEFYFNLCSIFGTLVATDMVRHLFNTRRQSGMLQNVPEFRITKWHIIWVWVFPIVIVCLPYTTHSYGPSDDDLLCWLKTETSSHYNQDLSYIWMFGTFYSFVIISMALHAFVYFRVVRDLQKSLEVFANASPSLLPLLNLIFRSSCRMIPVSTR